MKLFRNIALVAALVIIANALVVLYGPAVKEAGEDMLGGRAQITQIETYSCHSATTSPTFLSIGGGDTKDATSTCTITGLGNSEYVDVCIAMTSSSTAARLAWDFKGSVKTTGARDWYYTNNGTTGSWLPGATATQYRCFQYSTVMARDAILSYGVHSGTSSVAIIVNHR